MTFSKESLQHQIKVISKEINEDPKDADLPQDDIGVPRESLI